MKNNKTIIAVCIVVILVSAFFITTKVAGVSLGTTLDMGGHRIENMQSARTDGTGNLDAVTWSQVSSIVSVWTENAVPAYIYYNGGNVGIGNANPGGDRLKVTGGPINAEGGLVIERRTSEVGFTPAVGQIWICTDNDGTPGDCIVN